MWTGTSLFFSVSFYPPPLSLSLSLQVINSFTVDCCQLYSVKWKWPDAFRTQELWVSIQRKIEHAQAGSYFTLLLFETWCNKTHELLVKLRKKERVCSSKTRTFQWVLFYLSSFRTPTPPSPPCSTKGFQSYSPRTSNLPKGTQVSGSRLLFLSCSFFVRMSSFFLTTLSFIPTFLSRLI